MLSQGTRSDSVDSCAMPRKLLDAQASAAAVPYKRAGRFDMLKFDS